MLTVLLQGCVRTDSLDVATEAESVGSNTAGMESVFGACKSPRGSPPGEYGTRNAFDGSPSNNQARVWKRTLRFRGQEAVWSGPAHWTSASATRGEVGLGPTWLLGDGSGECECGLKACDKRLPRRVHVQGRRRATTAPMGAGAPGGSATNWTAISRITECSGRSALSARRRRARAGAHMRFCRKRPSGVACCSQDWGRCGAL